MPFIAKHSPSWPLQRPFWCSLWSRIFSLTEKSQCWWQQHCRYESGHRYTGFKHLLGIKLVHVDQPSDFDLCFHYFSGLSVPFLMVSALHWGTGPFGCWTWCLPQHWEKIKSILCGQLCRKNLQKSDVKRIPQDLTLPIIYAYVGLANLPGPPVSSQYCSEVSDRMPVRTLGGSVTCSCWLTCLLLACGSGCSQWYKRKH